MSPVVQHRVPHRNHFLRDLVTRVFPRSLRYAIVVMGFIDAFVSAHHQHRRSIENPGNFGDCMKVRICSRTSGNLSHKTHTCRSSAKFPSTKAQSQILFTPKPNRTISFFFLLIIRFEFEFRRRGIFLDSNYWCVQSSITHTMWL